MGQAFITLENFIAEIQSYGITYEEWCASNTQVNCPILNPAANINDCWTCSNWNESNVAFVTIPTKIVIELVVSGFTLTFVFNA